MKDKREVADEFEKRMAAKVFPHAAGKIREGKCPTCDRDIGEFRDASSEREYEISGMCQECQDSVFG